MCLVFVVFWYDVESSVWIFMVIFWVVLVVIGLIDMMKSWSRNCLMMSWIWMSCLVLSRRMCLVNWVGVVIFVNCFVCNGNWWNCRIGWCILGIRWWFFLRDVMWWVRVVWLSVLFSVLIFGFVGLLCCLCWMIVSRFSGIFSVMFCICWLVVRLFCLIVVGIIVLGLSGLWVFVMMNNMRNFFVVCWSLKRCWCVWVFSCLSIGFLFLMLSSICVFLVVFMICLSSGSLVWWIWSCGGVGRFILRLRKLCLNVFIFLRCFGGWYRLMIRSVCGWIVFIICCSRCFIGKFCSCWYICWSVCVMLIMLGIWCLVRLLCWKFIDGCLVGCWVGWVNLWWDVMLFR